MISNSPVIVGRRGVPESPITHQPPQRKADDSPRKQILRQQLMVRAQAAEKSAALRDTGRAGTFRTRAGKTSGSTANDVRGGEDCVCFHDVQVPPAVAHAFDRARHDWRQSITPACAAGAPLSAARPRSTAYNTMGDASMAAAQRRHRPVRRVL
jgi:hypothetical protein